MRDIYQYAQECINMLEDIGIRLGNIQPKDFSINTRAKNRFGECRTFSRNGHVVRHTININADLLDERNEDDQLINTILHELLHTVEGCQNHGAAWQYEAEKVRRAYGINISRTGDPRELNYWRGNMERVVNYKCCCEKCGYTYSRQRYSDIISHPENYMCGVCGGNIKRIL